MDPSYARISLALLEMTAECPDCIQVLVVYKSSLYTIPTWHPPTVLFPYNAVPLVPTPFQQPFQNVPPSPCHFSSECSAVSFVLVLYLNTERRLSLVVIIFALLIAHWPSDSPTMTINDGTSSSRYQSCISTGLAITINHSLVRFLGGEIGMTLARLQRGFGPLCAQSALHREWKISSLCVPGSSKVLTSEYPSAYPDQPVN